MAGKFKFSDYTVDDSGRDVEINGIPFRIRKKLTIGERQKASDAGVKISFDEKGQPRLDGVDQSALEIKMATIALLEWPFTDDDGKPTPIDEQHVQKLDPELLDALFAEIGKPQGPNLVPFAKASDVR